MSKYTTGEVAKLCGITVRTVQYYDTRGVLSPSELTEGGRRLYSESDVKMLKIICYLRELGLSINAITDIFKDDSSKEVVSLLLEQHEKSLISEYEEIDKKLSGVRMLKKELKESENFSVNTIGDVAKVMKTKDKMNKVRRNLWIFTIIAVLLEIPTILVWVLYGMWIPYVVVYAVMAIVGLVWFVPYYYKKVSYVCPNCHSVFKPTYKQMLLANHTYKTRKLTCTHCGEKHWCIEVYDENSLEE